jgi:hypothetical protein
MNDDWNNRPMNPTGLFNRVVIFPMRMVWM